VRNGIALFLCTAVTKAVNLPPGPVTVSAQDGANSTFDFTLSNVPAGYDVSNQTYPGWCVELNNVNNQTGDGRSAILLSTTGGNLPSAYSGKRWDLINYLLNHKQGPAGDVQVALWYYTDDFEPDPNTHPFAVAMVNEANAQGTGFVPRGNEITAVLVWWQGGDALLQGSMIEVRGGTTPPGGTPPTNNPVCLDRFTAGGFIYVNGSKANFGIQGGYQNGRLWGGINFVSREPRMHVKSRTVTSYTVIDANCRQATYDVTIDGEPGTATVLVCDYGEPGVADELEITLSNGFAASGDLGGSGHGGGNVQLHKPKCDDRPRVTPKPNGKQPGNRGGNGRGNGGGNGKGKGPKAKKARF
jgi:hypothetical protein